ncbi:unnamed protein product [Candida verbasci]|uniref:Uncharacterized protein n=1 Tax=Candida verbasci TaxID=1227364 RepID=A0A9W4XLM4_9ASCO|nr:unnamed protein product [Candida verbasci]
MSEDKINSSNDVNSNDANSNDANANDANANDANANNNSDPKLNQQDLDKIKDVASKILNPNNEHPQINEYIQSTFSYIGNAMYKMQTTNDRDATAKEIANDLTNKFETWVKNREEQQQQQQQKKQEEADNSESNEKKE